MDDNQIPVEIVKTPPPISSYFKTLSAVLGVFVLVAGLGIAVKLSQQKQETRTKASVSLVDLSLSPDQAQIDPGQDVNIAVGMNPHDYKVTAVDLKIAYDANKFDFVSFTKTASLPTVLTAATAVNGIVSTVLGSEASNPSTGSSVIANLILKAKVGVTGTGLVQITSDTQVAGIYSNGDAITTSILGDAGETNIEISAPVVASPTPTPTPTPIPTAIPVATPSSFPTPTPVGTSKIGDANNDGKVDGADYITWVNHYEQTTPNRALDGDFNEDGKVDGIDYSLWLNNYL